MEKNRRFVSIFNQMLLKQIRFHNFRHFTADTFSFNPFLTIVIGENSRGKTNLLEGIFFLTTGAGFREEKEEELIFLGRESGFVEGTFGLKDTVFQFKITLFKKEKGTEKNFFIAKAKKKHSQYVKEQTKAVLFTPEQIEMIIGAPSLRRDYFNKLISFYNFEYKKRLDNFDHALRRRNKVLERYYDEAKLKEELKFWDDYLINQASYITRERQMYINHLNKNQKLDAKEFSIEYLKDEMTKGRLEEVFEEEKRWRRTLIGPQKDDCQIYLAGKNIHHFGSRSEQRMALFWLKMNEIRYYEEMYRKKPIILLDDVFSELDLHNRKIVIDLIKKYQTVVTTTDIEMINLIEVPKTTIKL